MTNSILQKFEGREKTQGTTENRAVFVPVLAHFGRFRRGYHESSLIGTLYRSRAIVNSTVNDLEQKFEKSIFKDYFIRKKETRLL